MAKTNIWMAFYPKDYLGDTSDLSTQQHGAYMLLIMQYFINGGPLLDDDRELARITRLSLSMWRKERPRIVRFFGTQDGFLIHRRVDQELAKGLALSESNRNRAVTGWAKRKAGSVNTPNPDAGAMPDESPGNTQAMPGGCYSQSQSQSHCTKHEREPCADAQARGVGVERPGLREVLDEAQKIGIAPWKAEDWFNEMEGCGWLDFQHRPIANWRAVLVRVKVKWEADGRPAGPPSNAQRQSGGARAMSPLDLKTIIQAKETEAGSIKARFASETAMDVTWSDQGQRSKWAAIRKEIKALTHKLSQMA